MTKRYQTKKLQQIEKNKLLVLQNVSNKNSQSSSSTSSSATTESSDYIADFDDEQEENMFNIFDTIYDTSNESLDEEEHVKERESLQRMSFVSETNFFEDFTQLPELADVSEDISIASVIFEKESLLQDKSRDLGHFVDPLTGSELQNRLDSSLNVINDNFGEAMQEEQSLSESETSELDDIYVPEDDDFEETPHISLAEKQTEDFFGGFHDLDNFKIVDSVEVIDWESVMKQQKTKVVQQQTFDFLDDLIYKVVKIVEFVSPETTLRRNLDKRKLMQEISNVFHQYRVELNVSQLINLKTVEYFKRRNLYRPIVQGNVKNLLQEKENYIKALKHLNESLGKENCVRNSSKVAVTLHEKELKESEKKIEEEVQIFENMIRKYLYRLSSTQSNSVLEMLLRKMSKCRKEVSDVRLRMIKKQHTHALLLQKLAKLEDLGNGLTVKDYDQIQTEYVALEKKIEERNIDVNKLLTRSRKSLHLLAHIKEKHSILKDVIETQRADFDGYLDEIRFLRKNIFQLKLKHEGTRQEMYKLSIQVGLLDKPNLMYDYDQTEKRLNELHEIVNSLRITYETLQKKIVKLEKRISARNNHDFL